jgi:hypothetical protein
VQRLLPLTADGLRPRVLGMLVAISTKDWDGRFTTGWSASSSSAIALHQEGLYDRFDIGSDTVLFKSLADSSAQRFESHCWQGDAARHLLGTLCQCNEPSVSGVARVVCRDRQLPHVLVKVPGVVLSSALKWADGQSKCHRVENCCEETRLVQVRRCSSVQFVIDYRGLIGQYGCGHVHSAF